MRKPRKKINMNPHKIFEIDTSILVDHIVNRKGTVRHEVHYRGHKLTGQCEAEVNRRLDEIPDIIANDLVQQLTGGPSKIQRGPDHGEA